MYVCLTVLIISILLINFGKCNQNDVKQGQSMRGSVTVNRRGNVKFHTYSSNPSSGIEVDSHIIELPTKLFIYDAQFKLSNAREFLNYTNRLKKPIERIYVSHSHPDHWFGLDVLKSSKAKIYSLPSTREEIVEDGQDVINNNKPFFQDDDIPSTPTIPDTIVTEGYETVDGCLFEYRNIRNTESSNTLAIIMPNQGTALVGDFIFNGYHLFLGNNNFDNWINTLKYFQTKSPMYINLILVGHTQPADASDIQENINYLERAKRTLKTSRNFNSFKSEMVRLYPNFGGRNVLDLAKRALFPYEK